MADIERLKARRAAEFARIAQLLGEDASGPEEAVAGRAVTALEKLRADIGIPNRLGELGVTEAQLPGFAEQAFAVKRILRVNPREVTQEALEGILRSAL